MDSKELDRALAEAFEGSESARRVVARQARDLADAGKIEAELGFELTPEQIVSNLNDAPEDHDLVERWNWWLDSLELSHGGYNRFRVRPDAVQD
ncbi:hypothetical protein [Halorientalis salina]|uniref:hypothetical protein n=1 Tax=Halorientalis salina TaxID=2932266 RepID=UPI0010AB920C|nr:hypothetical protein [Halorientalis salina]